MVGTLNQSKTGKAHMGGCMCNMRAWGVHAQYVCVGGAHPICVHGGARAICAHGACAICTHRGACAICACGGVHTQYVYVGGAHAIYMHGGAQAICTHGGACAICACGGCTHNMHMWGCMCNMCAGVHAQYACVG